MLEILTSAIRKQKVQRCDMSHGGHVHVTGDMVVYVENPKIYPPKSNE